MYTRITVDVNENEIIDEITDKALILEFLRRSNENNGFIKKCRDLKKEYYKAGDYIETPIVDDSTHELIAECVEFASTIAGEMKLKEFIETEDNLTIKL